MSQVVHTHLTSRTSKGNLVRSPATLEYKDGRIYFLRSPFALKEEIKAMRGAHWHGRDEEDGRKIWSVDDCPRNRFQLAFLMGEDVYAWFDRHIARHDYSGTRINGEPVEVMPHQCDLADSGLTFHYQIWAAEMGCIDGEAIVHVNRAGKGFSMALAELYRKFHGGSDGGRRWDRRIPTYIRSLKGDRFGLNKICQVLDKGIRPVVKVTLASGKQIRCTADHEICTAIGYVRADCLKNGDDVLTNGIDNDVPRRDQIVGVQPDGTAHVFDVVCADPHRNFVANGIVVHNCGKTLAAQLVIERSAVTHWYWVGPKRSLANIRREFRKWGFDFDGPIRVEFLSYEALVRIMDEWKPEDELPHGVIFDESSRLKGATSQRRHAAQKLADMIRQRFGFDGYVIEMSGTPSPKSPLDWWSQAEIAWPGFLREGSPKALAARLAFTTPHEYGAGVFQKRIGWKDDARKCKHCGLLKEEGPHDSRLAADITLVHRYEPSTNEVAYLHERLKGLVQIKHKKDCLSLPEKRYRKVFCAPHPSTLRVAQAIASTAQNAMAGLTLLRELSDGFQYRDVKAGKGKCTHCAGSCGRVEEWFDREDEDHVYAAIDFLDEATQARLEKRFVPCPRCEGSGEIDRYERESRQIPCPKEGALKELLEECEESGRIVVFAGFQGSVDRATSICLKEGWDVVRCDGRGFEVFSYENGEARTVTTSDDLALDYWSDREHPRVAFVAHPESGGMSLTLTESRMAVFWSNSFKPEYRAQAEDRIHRKGMDENLGCEIVDLVHLATDAKVLDVIRDNRRLELMTLGEFRQIADTLEHVELKDRERADQEATYALAA